ncbi:MAG: TetR/AcrR family transcriptional regulator [bacterium]
MQSRKEQIIETAAILFKEKGFSAVTMRDLAAAMGIKAASLYNHISSKQEILKAIIIAIAEDFTTGMKNIKLSDYNAIGKLEQVIQLHVSIASSNIYGMASLNNDWMHLEEDLEYYLKLRTEYEDDFRMILEEGIKQNEIIDGNVEVMLFSILSTLRSLYLWIPKKENLDKTVLANQLSDVLLKGINK